MKKAIHFTEPLFSHALDGSLSITHITAAKDPRPSANQKGLEPQPIFNDNTKL